LFFKLSLRFFSGAGLLAAAACLNPAQNGASANFSFGIIDVGQGLAQIAQFGDSAVLIDIGTAESHDQWHAAYRKCGEPFIRAIVISHGHADHWGGLELLDSTVRWTGLVIVSPYEDTAFFRANARPFWGKRISFQTVSAGDTVVLPGKVAMRCLWPDKGLGDSLFTVDALRNRYSLVFAAACGATGFLVTSDIDSAAMWSLRLREKEALRASLFVVPHHGSGGSLDPAFYGYVRPETAVISYGDPNPYDHPSTQVLLWFNQMGVKVDCTPICGTVIYESNGYYWGRVNP
jgi:competence protein ComEC